MSSCCCCLHTEQQCAGAAGRLPRSRKDPTAATDQASSPDLAHRSTSLPPSHTLSLYVFAAIRSGQQNILLQN